MSIRRHRISGLRDHTGYWLNRLRMAVHTTFERALAGHDITVAQWSALIALYHGDATTPLGLAEFIDIDPGAATRLIDRLVAKGLLTRDSDPDDRRSVRLALTEKARALAPVLAAAADANDAAFFGVLAPEEHRQFRHLLARLLASHGIPASGGWLNDSHRGMEPMDQAVIDTMEACSGGSLDGTMTFPEVVRRLAAAGVESYRADLFRLEKTYAMPDGETHVVRFTGLDPTAFSATKIGTTFSAEAVKAALLAVQGGAIDYRTFLARIMEAGTASYSVHIVGRRALYVGRHGDLYVEPFPPAP